MGREINLDSIPALDVEIIRLKRTRNSLLNIARIPPEILSHIFHLSTTKAGDPHFGGIPKGSYNFLLVCHHWFKVALSTPELWTSWGNNLKDWKRWHLRSGSSALDLIFDGYNYRGGGFDEIPGDALKDRVARNVIRKVHLKSERTLLLTAIISLLIPEGQDVRPSSVESIVLSNVNIDFSDPSSRHCVRLLGEGGLDISNLFARHCFPKLRNLHLSGYFRISSWDCLKSTTMALTNLSLNLGTTGLPSSTGPTTSQILSLLASNPNLRSLALRALPINDDSGGGPSLQVPLHHLEYISLSGNFRRVFAILHRLELPEGVDDGEITLVDCTAQEILEVVGPYIHDYLQRDGRFRDRLGVLASSDSGRILFEASVIEVGYRGPDRLPQHSPPYARFWVWLFYSITHCVGLCTRVLALLPQESIVSLKTDLQATEEILVAVPNLEALYLISPVVPNRFLLPDPKGPNAYGKLLPSLRRLYLEGVKAVDDNWDPLVTYLTCQTFGGQAVSLNVFGEGVHVCSEVIKQIESLVEELIYVPDLREKCPFDKCP